MIALAALIGFLVGMVVGMIVGANGVLYVARTLDRMDAEP